jgi:2',3'-cyclic-nucleotide 2'-phosphodiesterase/3'-nucleotidase
VYRVDRKKPAGSRVRIIHMADGSPFRSEEQYHVVMSTYRARGGGGHMTTGIGLTPDELLGRIVWVSERDIRTIFRDELIARTQIRPRPLNHWRYL